MCLGAVSCGEKDTKEMHQTEITHITENLSLTQSLYQALYFIELPMSEDLLSLLGSQEYHLDITKSDFVQLNDGILSFVSAEGGEKYFGINTQGSLIFTNGKGVINPLSAVTTDKLASGFSYDRLMSTPIPIITYDDIDYKNGTYTISQSYLKRAVTALYMGAIDYENLTDSKKTDEDKKIAKALSALEIRVSFVFRGAQFTTTCVEITGGKDFVDIIFADKSMTSFELSISSSAITRRLFNKIQISAEAHDASGGSLGAFLLSYDSKESLNVSFNVPQSDFELTLKKKTEQGTQTELLSKLNGIKMIMYLNSPDNRAAMGSFKYYEGNFEYERAFVGTFGEGSAVYEVPYSITAAVEGADILEEMVNKLLTSASSRADGKYAVLNGAMNVYVVCNIAGGVASDFEIALQKPEGATEIEL